MRGKHLMFMTASFLESLMFLAHLLLSPILSQKSPKRVLVRGENKGHLETFSRDVVVLCFDTSKEMSRKGES
jgi:hypothetical protein